MWAIPPNIHSVMEVMVMPYRLAVQEWPSSCNSTPTNSPTAAAPPSSRGVLPAWSAARSTLCGERRSTAPA